MAGILVLANAFLIDGTGREPVDGAAVVVEDHVVRDVIPSGRVGPLGGRVETLDLRGRTLLPGLTDAHVHVCAVEGNTASARRGTGAARPPGKVSRRPPPFGPGARRRR